MKLTSAFCCDLTKKVGELKNYFVYKIILCLLRENQTCLEKKERNRRKHSRLAAVYQKILPLGKIHNQVIQKSCKSYYSKSQERYICIFYTFLKFKRVLPAQMAFEIPIIIIVICTIAVFSAQLLRQSVQNSKFPFKIAVSRQYVFVHY